MPRSVLERFRSKYREVPSGCWEWTAFTHRGYGRFSIGRRTLKAHRVAYELLVGPIPDGMELDHLCRNRSCVNPEHLEPVVHRENVLRGEGIAARSAVQESCVNGHPFDTANTYIRPDRGGRCRECRTCTREANRRVRQSRRDQR